MNEVHVTPHEMQRRLRVFKSNFDMLDVKFNVEYDVKFGIKFKMRFDIEFEIEP